jgi:nucleoside-diphosphate-sugar epimerase
MHRDFTYIDDVTRGILRVIDHVPWSEHGDPAPPARIYNIGNNRSEDLMPRYQATNARMPISIEGLRPKPHLTRQIVDIGKGCRYIARLHWQHQLVRLAAQFPLKKDDDMRALQDLRHP